MQRPYSLFCCLLVALLLLLNAPLLNIASKISTSNFPYLSSALQVQPTVPHLTVISDIYAMPANSAKSAVREQDTGSQSSSNESSTTVADGITRDEVNRVARELWCPLCSGVRLDTCELKACEQMREEIAIQLAEGRATDEIKEYFLAQYGPQILGEPPRSGFNWLAWIVPFVALFGGGVYLLTFRRRLPQHSQTQHSQTQHSQTQHSQPQGEYPSAEAQSRPVAASGIETPDRISADTISADTISGSTMPGSTMPDEKVPTNTVSTADSQDASVSDANVSDGGGHKYEQLLDQELERYDE